MTQTQNRGAPDVVLIGAGIMSATLGAVLKELESSLNITIFESLDDCGQETRKPGTMRVPATRPVAN